MRSALKAGYAQEYAEKITAVMSENVRETMAAALDAAGLTDERLAKRHLELSDASQIERFSFKKDLRDEEITSVMESVAGCIVVYVREDETGKVAYVQTADHRSRKDAIDLAYKIKGHYAPDEHEVTGASVMFLRPDPSKPKEA